MATLKTQTLHLKNCPRQARVTPPHCQLMLRYRCDKAHGNQATHGSLITVLHHLDTAPTPSWPNDGSTTPRVFRVIRRDSQPTAIDWCQRSACCVIRHLTLATGFVHTARAHCQSTAIPAPSVPCPITGRCRVGAAEKIRRRIAPLSRPLFMQSRCPSSFGI